MIVWLFFLITLALCSSANAAIKRTLPMSVQPVNFPRSRRLSAAVAPAKLKARARFSQEVLAYRASFDFMHDDTTAESVFATTLSVKSKWPILSLEELDHHLEDVTCSESHIEMFFASIEQFQSTQQELERTTELIVVTSHRGCNSDGERSAYRVTEVTVDVERRIVSLRKSDCSWQDAFESTRVSFSRRSPSEIQKRSHGFVKRQQPQTDMPATTKTMEKSGATPTVNFPVPPAVTSGYPTTANKALKFQYIDKQIYPPDIPAANMFLPEGITVSCRNCSLGGSIDITKGSFEVTGSDGIMDSVNRTIAFFEHGSIDVAVNGLFSQIELEFDLSASQNLISYPIQLPAIPLVPFEIPGVLVFGPLFQGNFDISLSLKESIGFSYGFNLSVPDNSRIELNMNEISNSSITGFDKSTVHALPFQAKSALTSLVARAVFKPQILLGINTAVGSVQGGIGAFLELPNLSLNVTQLSHVNEHCEAASSGDGKLSSTLDNVFGNLTHIVPNVDINLGALANFEVEVPRLFTEAAAVQTVLASTSYPLPTACLEFDSGSGKFGKPSPSPTPTPSPTVLDKTATTTADSKKSWGTVFNVNAYLQIACLIVSLHIAAW
ncbi:putative GPI anchored protein [Aspergillus clavatus NRRL 1]|uniref:GPI anchored protein n=1 Tax=Aspergillus clavatus (strain ATCC 1007 / CBS 513.65 / DSM 816 / NCTC 3887 / NRRL 1 / QM 1276 / 107) TaxID=344612 RepID=A1CFH2_ASPCL|nr:uncharacterized protein ACLA_093200 [Aspergillus clavatus NRRL 1]EAW11621.1 conserved hypothetical protein [Aspergillus clavatus NRRL 1]